MTFSQWLELKSLILLHWICWEARSVPAQIMTLLTLVLLMIVQDIRHSYGIPEYLTCCVFTLLPLCDTQCLILYIQFYSILLDRLIETTDHYSICSIVVEQHCNHRVTAFSKWWWDGGGDHHALSLAWWYQTVPPSFKGTCIWLALTLYFVARPFSLGSCHS